MIWGELITQIRNLHLELLDQYSLQPTCFSQDMELQAEGFPYPASNGEYGDWEPTEIPAKIAEALEFHAVERVLLEGPLLPIQEVNISSDHWEPLYQAIFKLEVEWLQKAKLSSPDKLTFIEQSLRAKFLSLRRKHSGHSGLKLI